MINLYYNKSTAKGNDINLNYVNSGIAILSHMEYSAF